MITVPRSKDIICIATKRIDDKLPTNVQQLMTRLAASHRILYVEPPVDHVFLKRHPEFLERGKQIMRQCPPNFYPIWPLIFPFEQRVPFFIKSINRHKITRSIKSAMSESRIRPDILWLFRPQDIWVVNRIHPSYVCYHITDKYSTMPGNARNKADFERLIKLERKTLQRADIVFCTARSLWEEVSPHHQQAVFVGNVADFEHFAKACHAETKVPMDVVDLPRPIIGFFGAINNFKLDYDLIEATSEATSNGSILMIGPIGGYGTEDTKDVPRKKNIHYLGAKDYLSLPGYLKVFDACIIPYRDSSYTKHVFPLKFFEYLAAGKPVVSTPLPSLKDFCDVAYFARTSEEWKTALELAISEDNPARAQRRKEVASANSWGIRVKEIEALLHTL